jgi:hypothetical protein
MIIKQQFTELCKMIFIGSNGFQFPFDDVDHDDDLIQIRESVDYPVLKSKMENLIILINKDNSLINKDVETELWDLI